ncbi:MAG TPA: ligand-binding protein SH3 [Candidatus Moranbacteria bacterium]|nr:MAG: hypothetical protein UW87_C0008G0011 [Candidatus Moranbacteria bacterium GW2011_GWC2_45_10]KKT93061.1 MAG: Small multidrug export protein [Parcubacteria group bacterium GW2011_GWC1_45_14]HAV11708.1 ligand-binding protein SH3 [Candidatus Moranbacteria bacterium]
MKQEIITFLTAAAPILEVRGAIPLAMGVFQFSPLKAYTISVLGNIFLIMPFLFVLQRFSEYLMHKWYHYNRLMTWVLERAQRKHMDHFHEKKWVEVALFLFVAVPLPMTGAWSGAVAAYILGVPFWRAIGVIFAGILAAGGIVTALVSLGFMATKSIF